MTKKLLDKSQMQKALQALDHYLPHAVELVAGGGGAMVMAYAFPIATSDIDAIPKGMDFDEINKLVKQVAEDLQLPTDWLNPYYYSFAHVLPSSYGERLINVYQGKFLKVLALGKEDLLIMKCFAHRTKDIGHTKALLKAGANIDFVENHIQSLLKKRIKGSQEALDFLFDICDQMDI
jgi:hypothetical protein